MRNSGFEGASLESIAAAIGISRHNLLYYFPSALWPSARAGRCAHPVAGGHGRPVEDSDDPQQALRRYIRAKLHYSRTRPQGAKVFTKEVIAGAPRYGTAITERVAPLLKTEVRTFERWAREGRIAKVNFTHLMFIIWSVTQAYAGAGGPVRPAAGQARPDRARLRKGRRADRAHGVERARRPMRWSRRCTAHQTLYKQ